MTKPFIQQNLKNPIKELMKQGFCQHFMKSIIKDDLLFSLDEKNGMKKLLTYILPSGYTIPQHSTVHCDLTSL